jgi:hypothetical protein
LTVAWPAGIPLLSSRENRLEAVVMPPLDAGKPTMNDPLGAAATADNSRSRSCR